MLMKTSQLCPMYFSFHITTSSLCSIFHLIFLQALHYSTRLHIFTTLYTVNITSTTSSLVLMGISNGKATVQFCFILMMSCLFSGCMLYVGCIGNYLLANTSIQLEVIFSLDAFIHLSYNKYICLYVCLFLCWTEGIQKQNIGKSVISQAVETIVFLFVLNHAIRVWNIRKRSGQR